MGTASAAGGGVVPPRPLPRSAVHPLERTSGIHIKLKEQRWRSHAAGFSWSWNFHASGPLRDASVVGEHSYAMCISCTGHAAAMIMNPSSYFTRRPSLTVSLSACMLRNTSLSMGHTRSTLSCPGHVLVVPPWSNQLERPRGSPVGSRLIYGLTLRG